MRNICFLKKIAVSAVIAASLMLILPCGCMDKDKNEAESIDPQNSLNIYESSTAQTITDPDGQDSSAESSYITELSDDYSRVGSDELFPIRTDKNEEHSGELEYRITSIYNSKDIVTGTEHKKPAENKLFFIAELELINNTDDLINFRSVFDVIPSVDDGVISMSNYINEFPASLNGINNLQNEREIPVYKHSSVSGYIGFEGPEQFSVVELTFCNEFGVTDSFRFSKNGIDTVSKPEPLAKGEADGLETAMYECGINDGSKYSIPPADEGFCYLSVTTEIKNVSDRMLEADTKDIQLICGNEKYDNLFPDMSAVFIPPGKHIRRELVMCVPVGSDKFALVQTKTKDTVLFEFDVPHDNSQ